MSGQVTESNSLEEQTAATDAAPGAGDVLPGDRDNEKLVDVEWRRQAIADHYDDVDGEDARVIAEMLRAHLDGDDLSKFEATQQVVDRTDLARSRVTDIFWTERTSVQHVETVVECQESDVIGGLSLYGGDDCEPPVCENAQAEIEARGGEVTPSELKSILREQAEEYAAEGATPERVDHWVAHHECKAVIRSHFD